MDAAKDCSEKYPSQVWLKAQKDWQNQMAKGVPFRCLIRILRRLKLASVQDIDVFANAVYCNKTKRYFELNGTMFPKH